MLLFLPTLSTHEHSSLYSTMYAVSFVLADVEGLESATFKAVLVVGLLAIVLRVLQLITIPFRWCRWYQ